MVKAGNLCIFTVFCFTCFFLIALGAGLIFLGIFEMTKLGKFNMIDGGACAAGLITAIIGLLGFCGRRSMCIVTFELFLLIVLLCAYVALTIFYWSNKACDLNEDTKKMCEEVENLIGPLFRYVLVGSDGLIVFFSISQKFIKLVVIIFGLMYRSSLADRQGSDNLLPLYS